MPTIIQLVIEIALALTFSSLDLSDITYALYSEVFCFCLLVCKKI